MRQGDRQRALLASTARPLPRGHRRDGARHGRPVHADDGQGSRGASHTRPVTVLLLATGGTIASRKQADGSVAVALTGAELLESVSTVYTSDVEVFDLIHGPSRNLDIPTMATIALNSRDALVSGRAAP